MNELVDALPAGVHGLANIAGLPPSRPAADVIKVNLVGLKYLTQLLVPKLADGASIANLASLAGLGWPDAKDTIAASASLGFDDVTSFCEAHNLKGARSYFFSKEALIVWTVQNRWTWRSRGIRMNAVSPGPVGTPILKDLVETLGKRAEEDMKTMDRPRTPADIAPVVSFLLSDEARWIRGTNVPSTAACTQTFYAGPTATNAWRTSGKLLGHLCPISRALWPFHSWPSCPYRAG